MEPENKVMPAGKSRAISEYTQLQISCRYFSEIPSVCRPLLDRPSKTLQACTHNMANRNKNIIVVSWQTCEEATSSCNSAPLRQACCRDNSSGMVQLILCGYLPELDELLRALPSMCYHPAYCQMQLYINVTSTLNMVAAWCECC